MDNLPPELLVRIFKEVDLIPLRIRSLPGPVLMSHTCAFWRAIALAEATLWTNISITFQKDRYTSKLIKSTETGFARSKSSLVDVVIDAKPSLRTELRHRPDAALTFVKTLNVVRANASRIRSLHFLCPDVNCAYALVGQLKGTMAPALISLRVTVDKVRQLSDVVATFWPPAPPTPVASNLPFDFLSSDQLVWPCITAPSLRHLTLSSTCVPVGPTLEELTHLDLGRQSLAPLPTTFSYMVRKCPKLQTLVLQRCVVPWTAPHSVTSDIVHAPNIRHLSISYMHAASVSALRYASLPALVCLEFAYELPPHRLQHQPTDSDDPLQQLVDLLPAPSAMPRLRKLCLTHFAGLGPVSAATTAYFRELNTVEHLHLTDTAGAFILPVTTAAAVSRRRSITFLSEMESTARSSRGRHKRFDMNNDTSFTDPSIFPNLHTVSLNTFRAADVAWLCNFVVSRESSISTVRLSPSAMRHLEGSLRKRGDHIETARLLVVGLRDRELENMLPRDMDRWLRSRVKVEPEDTTGIYQSRQSFTPNSI